MNIPDAPAPGDPLRAEFAAAIVDCLREFALGPEVAPPLVNMGGVVFLADPFKVYHARATSDIAARSGDQMGSGSADLYSATPAGVLAPVAGFRGVTAWNDVAKPIPSGTRLKVMFLGGLWVIFNGDCSGTT